MTQQDHERSADDLDAVELRLLIQRVARRIRAKRGDAALSDAQLSVLFHLEMHGDSSLGRLAEHDRVTPPSMTRTVASLKESGYLETEPGKDDARRVIARITPKGLAMVQETRRLRTAWFAAQLGDLSPAERSALQEVMPILRRIAES